MNEFELASKTSTQVKEPSEYKVYLLNDDITTMEFVIKVLMRIFSKSTEEAVTITKIIHNKGRGLIGIYCYDIAITKVDLVHEWARREGFPLQAIYEKV